MTTATIIIVLSGLASLVMAALVISDWGYRLLRPEPKKKDTQN